MADPLFDAILAAPDDDAPRLAFARALTERGDPRGENIRISCELEHLERGDPARAALQIRADAPPCFWWFEPISARFPLVLSRRRGFIEKLECAIWDFVKHADEIFRIAPLRVYEANPIGEWGPELAKCAALSRLRRLVLGWSMPEARTAILASPHLANLPELEMAARLFERAHVETLARDLQHLGKLRELHLSSGTIDLAGCAALGKLAEKLDLELLDVRGAVVDGAGLVEMRARLGEGRLLPRPVPRLRYAFGELDLSGGKLSPTEIRALVDSGEYRGATKILLASRIGDDGVAHLARSGAFPALVQLELGATAITDIGARVLAREAIGFEHLEHIGLGDLRGVSDAVVDELARSPRLPALRSIAREIEHRPPYADASEGRELIPIQRDDGRVVESIIWHSIWP